MTHAEICPVCNGKGIVPNQDLKCCGEMVKCHGCGGSGWITIQDPSPYIPKAKYRDESNPTKYE